MAVIGSTGSGKTRLLSHVVEARAFNVYIRTKGDDVRFDRSWHRTDDPRAIRNPQRTRILLDLSGNSRILKATKVRWLIKELSGDGRKPIGWTVTFDEMFYAYEKLRLGEDIEEAETQWRSRYGTIIGGMQRPVRVSRFVISEAQHVVAFGMERRDAKELGEATADALADVVQTLRWEHHEFAWWSRARKSIWVGRLNVQTGILEATRRAA